MESVQQVSDRGGVSPSRAAETAFHGRYEIISEVGRGAMGVVYKAHDRVIGRAVALKTIDLGANSPDHDNIVDRLKSEAKTAGSLDHPNIVTIYDVGDDRDRVYLSMQFIEGSTLASILEGKNLLPGALTILNYTEQICNAVAFAHERGVVHRDLKPSNLMLTPQGQIKVLDFGIAKKGNVALTRSGIVVGTPSYMAPEQATGKNVDHRSDIFALGAVFYELFTGKKAFDADSITAVLYNVVHEDPVPPATVNPALQPGIDAIIRRALEKNPEARFQNCTEMRDALRKEAVLLRTASAKVYPKLVETGKHAKLTGKRRSRAAMWATLGFCFLLGAAGSAAWSQRTKMPRLMRFIAYVQQHASLQKLHLTKPPAAASAQQQQNPSDAPVNATTLPDVSANSAAPGGAGNPAAPAVVGNPAAPAASPAGQPESQVQNPSTTAQQSQPAVPAASTVSSPPSQPLAANTNSPPATSQTTPVAPAQIKDPKDSQASASEGSESDEAAQAATETSLSEPRKHTRPAAPAVVDGFTRNDVPDLLRRAAAAAGSGDYRSAEYEYQLVLKLEPQNKIARDGLRRAKVAATER